MTPPAASVRAAVQVERDELEQFQRAARLLLANPLVTETWPRPGALAQIRRWETVLKNEFNRVLGYRLDVGRTSARLYRRAATTSRHRGGRTRTGRPLGHLACASLCLALAALEGLGDQTTASQLSQEVLRLRSGDDALTIDLTQYDQRKAFVDAVKWLEDRGVLRVCDGAVDLWLSDASGDALYDIDGDLLSRILVASPSVLRDVSEPADFLVDTYAPSEEGQRNRIRHRLGRRLLEGPVVSYQDLDADELDYVRQRRTRLAADLERLTGCRVESRSEGLALVDVATEPLSGEMFLGAGTETQAALLWGAALVDTAAEGFVVEPKRDGDTGRVTAPAPWRPVAAAVADRRWDEVVAAYGTRFKAEYRTAPARLRPAVEALLDRFGLVAVEADGTVLVHAALARYRPLNQFDGPAEALPAGLFDGDDASG